MLRSVLARAAEERLRTRQIGTVTRQIADMLVTPAVASRQAHSPETPIGSGSFGHGGTPSTTDHGVRSVQTSPAESMTSSSATQAAELEETSPGETTADDVTTDDAMNAVVVHDLGNMTALLNLNGYGSSVATTSDASTTSSPIKMGATTPWPKP